MGCDIHGTVETKVDGKWVMVNRLEVREEFGRRNYERFGRLAGVRHSDIDNAGFPKGLPHDISDSTSLYVREWGADGHSHSFLDAKEAADIFLQTDYSPTDYAKEYPMLNYFGIDKDEYPESRIVFFFDN